jgi:hypothetical protein
MGDTALLLALTWWAASDLEPPFARRRGDAFAFSFQAVVLRVKVLQMCDHFRALQFIQWFDAL